MAQPKSTLLGANESENFYTFYFRSPTGYKKGVNIPKNTINIKELYDSTTRMTPEEYDHLQVKV